MKDSKITNEGNQKNTYKTNKPESRKTYKKK